LPGTRWENLTTPLINRSAIEAAFRGAKAGQLQAFYRYQKSILSGFVDVRNELSAMQNLQEENNLKGAEVSARNESVTTSTELFKTGRATYLEVILAQQNALQAKLDLVEVKKQLLLASVHMYKALGGGWK
jgi:outer membrane protein TolC